jgi:hypothetical protein
MGKTPAEICIEIKRHIAGIRDLLQGLYGDREGGGSPERYTWPLNVRVAAYEAITALNRARITAATEFEILHDALGLGPLNWSGPCGHEKRKDDG